MNRTGSQEQSLTTERSERLALILLAMIVLASPAIFLAGDFASRPAPPTPTRLATVGNAALTPMAIVSIWFNYRTILTILMKAEHTPFMPRTRMDELFSLADANDGLLTSKQAREMGIKDSVLIRLAQRGRLERMARGVYRIVHYPAARFAQYREAVLWAQASHGPQRIALSHETAFLLFGISDANPANVHLTVPKQARLRREKPDWIAIHRANLAPDDLTQHEGMPVTSIERTVIDVLTTTHRIDLVRQAIADARREGYLNSEHAARLRQTVNRYAHKLASGAAGKKAINSESKTS
ncbi:MAG: type IV toxin-antitoxin system AbiEi family antitoxin domain-containing protein [Terriglobia bacterium]